MIKKIRNSELAQQFASYVNAEAGLIIHGKAPEEVIEHRRQVCTGLTIEGKSLHPPCESFEPIEPGNFKDGYCKGCGCINWARSKMSVKWTMPTLACPKGFYPAVKCEEEKK